MDEPKRNSSPYLGLIGQLAQIDITDKAIIAELEEAVTAGIAFKELAENELRSKEVKKELTALEKAITGLVEKTLKLDRSTRKILNNELYKHMLKPGDKPGTVKYDGAETDFFKTLPEKLQCLKERVKSAKNFSTRRGTDPIPGRDRLADCIAMILDNNGVELTKYDKGTFYLCLKICLKMVWDAEHYEQDLMRVVSRAIDRRKAERETFESLFPIVQTLLKSIDR